MDKGDIIIDAVLEPYKPIAAIKAKENVCATCSDRRCERGEPCKTYIDFVRTIAWAMIAEKNTQALEGGGFGQSKN